MSNPPTAVYTCNGYYPLDRAYMMCYSGGYVAVRPTQL